jgi:chemotaxis response regulator CheB
MAIARDPISCEQSSMPLHAVEAKCVDHILIPEDMPPVILGHVKKTFQTFNESIIPL